MLVSQEHSSVERRDSTGHDDNGQGDEAVAETVMDKLDDETTSDVDVDRGDGDGRAVDDDEIKKVDGEREDLTTAHDDNEAMSGRVPEKLDDETTAVNYNHDDDVHRGDGDGSAVDEVKKLNGEHVEVVELVPDDDGDEEQEAVQRDSKMVITVSRLVFNVCLWAHCGSCGFFLRWFKRQQNSRF